MAVAACSSSVAPCDCFSLALVPPLRCLVLLGPAAAAVAAARVPRVRALVAAAYVAAARVPRVRALVAAAYVAAACRHPPAACVVML